MTDLLYNLDSTEVAYGDNALNAVIQIQERISNISDYIQNHELNDFEKSQIEDRLNKLIDLNIKIQDELENQVAKLNNVVANVRTEVKINPLH